MTWREILIIGGVGFVSFIVGFVFAAILCVASRAEEIYHAASRADEQ